MAGSEPLQLSPSASHYSLGVCLVEGEVYDLYGGQHRVVRRDQVVGPVIFGNVLPPGRKAARFPD